MNEHNVLPAWLWLWFPFIIILLVIFYLIFDPRLAWFMVGDEQGIIEPATVIVLLPAIYFGFQSVFYNKALISIFNKIWILLVTLGCTYFAGEEISWGQHIFNWETPDFIAQVNDQNETNIHNINNWFNQKPRLLLEFWILVGGVLFPIWRLSRNIKYPADAWQYWFWPPAVCFPTALLAVLVRMPERLENYFNVTGIMYLRYSELQELYFALFLLLYLYAIKKRLIG